RRTAGGTAAGRSTLTRLPAERHDVTVLDGHRAALRDRPPGFLVEDLPALPAGRPVLVDRSGILPRDLAPLLRRPEQAAFRPPTPAFRKAARTARYADPVRAGACRVHRPRSATPGHARPRPAAGGAVASADPLHRTRPRATGGEEDPRTAPAERLVRDDLRDDEVRRQAGPHAAALTVDGTTPAAGLAEPLATRFALPRR
ncbi:hypothetical protein ACFVVL_28325, partial [Kitasatospora sp. NPDC058115]